MKKTQGQKRKGRVTAIAVLLFCGLTATGVYFYQQFMGDAYEWVDRHAETTGTVVDMEVYEDEYRNARGRKRTSVEYYISYTFDVDGEEMTSDAEISKSLYNSLGEGSDISVWYDPEEPAYQHALADEVAGGAKTSLSSALLFVAPITGGVCWFLHAVFMFLFGRESRKKLAEGFYTENSWLDVEDDKLVLLQSQTVSVANFEKSERSKITKAYQEGASSTELILMLKPKQLKSIELKDITSVSSRHDEDTIAVNSEEESISLDFLNIGTKAHAVEYLEKALPIELKKSTVKRTRLRSVAPRLAFIATLAAIGAYLSSFIVWFVLGFVMVMVTPKLIRRLIDPSVLTEFEAVTEKSDNPVLEEDSRKAA